MAQQSANLSECNTRYESIKIELDKLFDANSQCSQCIDMIGSESDTKQFRKTMTTQIRDATSLCRSIKSNFNKINDIHNHDIQTSQQTFINLHSELKDIVSQIKVKTKQHEPHKNDKNNNNNNNKQVKQQNNPDAIDPNEEYEKDDELNKLKQDLLDMKQVYSDLKILSEKKKEIENMDNNIVVKHVLFQGWMDKKSRYMHRWRRRWVVLDKNTEDITLFTFKQCKQYTDPTESVIIDDDIQIQLNHTTENQFIIYNTITKYKFVFKALNRQKRKEWIEILQTQQKNGNQYNNAKNNPIITPQNIQNIQNIVMHPNAEQNENINVNIDVNINDMNSVHDENKNYDILNHNGSYNEHEVALHDENINNNSAFEFEHEHVAIEPGAAVNVHAVIEPGAAPKENVLHMEMESNDHDEIILSNDKIYDINNAEVKDCLLLIDDLSHMREIEEDDSENNRIINAFEKALRDRGFVTKDQIDKLRDVAIKLIGFMFDKDVKDPITNT